MSVTLAFALIVRSEEDMLARCLSSLVDHCDELIVVDTGSTDDTKAIARQFND